MRLRIESIVLVLMLLAVGFVCWQASCHADEYSKVEVRVSINDEETNLVDSGLITKFFSNGARQQEKVTLPAATFTALTWPASAEGVMIVPNSANSPVGLVLKGVTGDTGISLDSTFPILLPLSSDKGNITLGILNQKASSDSVRVFWL